MGEPMAASNTPMRPAWKIFISYSRADRAFVVPFATAMRAAGASSFRDEDSIDPGEQWADVIAESIAACEKLFVFWSVAASDSKAVEGEYNSAIALGKVVVPVLLDDTPLPDRLSVYQWIDFRRALKVGAARTKTTRLAPPAPIVNSLDPRLQQLPPSFSWLQWMAVNDLLPPMLTDSELAELIDATMPFVFKDVEQS